MPSNKEQLSQVRLEASSCPAGLGSYSGTPPPPPPLACSYSFLASQRSPLWTGRLFMVSLSHAHSSALQLSTKPARRTRTSSLHQHQPGVQKTARQSYGHRWCETHRKRRGNMKEVKRKEEGKTAGKGWGPKSCACICMPQPERETDKTHWADSQALLGNKNLAHMEFIISCCPWRRLGVRQTWKAVRHT